MIDNTRFSEHHPKQHGSLQQEAAAMVDCFVFVSVFWDNSIAVGPGGQGVAFRGYAARK